MPNRSSKKKDINENAFSIMQRATGEVEPVAEHSQKNPATVALGRLGGLKGGKARFENLTPARRKAIAEKAAAARWSKIRKQKK